MPRTAKQPLPPATGFRLQALMLLAACLLAITVYTPRAEAAQAQSPGADVAAAPTPRLVAANDKRQDANQAVADNDLDALVTTAGKGSDPVLDEKNLLILNLGVDDMLLHEGMLGYDDGSQVFLPFETLMEAIAFPIKTSSDLRTADGWFLSEDTTFHLDRNTRQVTIKGKTSSFPDYQVRDDGFGLYVSTQLLQKWFPIKFDVSVSKLEVMLRPTTQLPIQAKLARMQGRRIAKRGEYSVKLPVRDLDYEAFSVHGADLYMSNNIQKNEHEDDAESVNRYAITYTGDLAFFNTKVYAAGKDNDVDNYLETLRVTGERIDPTASMLGPLKATRIILGDVTTVRFPGQGSRGGERGFYIDNNELGGSSLFDSTTVAGDSLPGWEVELYHNGRLLGVVEVGDDGRYEFRDVELYYGRNDVVLKFYGPEGQRRTERKYVDVGREMLRPGAVKYALSLVEQNSQTIDYDPDPASIDDNAIMGTGILNFGVSDWLSLFTGINTLQKDKERHNYLYFGASMHTDSRLYMRMQSTYDTSGGQKASISLNKAFDHFSLNLDHESFFHDYYDQANTDEDNGHTTGASLGFALPDITEGIGLSNTFSASREEEDNKSTTYSLGYSVTASILEDTTLSHSLSTSSSEDDAGSFDSLSGGATLRGDYTFKNSKIGTIELYGDLGYTIRPIKKITDYDLKFTERWPLTTHLSAFATLKRLKENVEDDPYNAIGAGLTITLGKLRISPSLSYSDDGIYSMDTTFNMPLGLDPRTGMPSVEERNTSYSGAVSVRLFLDRNYNYIYDEGDTPLENVAVKATQMGRQRRTDNRGVARLSGLATHMPVDIEVVKEDDWNYFWTLVTKGEAVYVRPGKTYTIDYPVQVTGEIDGNIYLGSASSNDKNPVVPLELVNNDGLVVKTVKSTPEGFYLFKEVRPGSYVVRPAPEFLLKHHLFAMPSQVITITEEGVAKSWIDIAMYADKPDLLEESADRFTAASPELAVVKGFSASAFATPVAHAGNFVAAKGFSAFPTAATSATAVPTFGVHVASYSTRASARQAIAEFTSGEDQLLGGARFGISPVYIEGKGTFYRVVAGPFEKAQAQAFAATISERGQYARVMKMP